MSANHFKVGIRVTMNPGRQMGCQDLIAKMVMLEESARVPWLNCVAMPAVLDLLGVGSDGLNGASVLSHDIPASDVVPMWPVNEGRANDNLLNGKEATRQHPGERARQKWMLRGESRRVVTSDYWKLILSDQNECELYDLNRDSLELHNLAATEPFKALELRAQLTAWQKMHGEEGWA